MEERNFLEAQYCMRHEAVLLEEMNEVTVSQSEMLKSKEQHILELKTYEMENMLVTEQLKGDNKDLRSTVKLLEEKKTKKIGSTGRGIAKGCCFYGGNNGSDFKI